MSISIKKLGVLVVAAAVLVVLAALRPTAQAPVAEADLGAPGGIAALPSAAPAIPGIANQGIPAIIGTGQAAIVAVFCESIAGGLPGAASPCPDTDANPSTVWGSISLKMEQVFPGSGAPMATFAATGTDTQVVTDNSGGDMDAANGVVTVRVNAAAATTGGTQGVNEIIRVTATDETGDSRTVTIVVVDTILAWGPTGAISTASQEQPTFISYHCDTLGRAAVPLGSIPGNADWDLDTVQGLDDMYDGLYVGYFAAMAGAGYGTNTLLGDADIADVWCGGNTVALFDDFVDFQTDKGLFSVDPGAVALQSNSASLGLGLGIFYPPSLDFDCGEGKNIDTFDIDALSVWAAWIFAPVGAGLEGGCDADGWRNGVVTTQILGTGEVGVATINAQQGGGISPTREINVTFTGEAALSLFIDAPASVGISGAEFSAMVVDQEGRPVGDETVECTVEPAGGALTILPQTGTTGGVGDVDADGNSVYGEVTFSLVPTGASVIGGEELTLTCVLDRDRSVSASETLNLSQTPDLESVDLVAGCNPVASTWPDGTAADVAAAQVTPADAVDAIWKFDPGSGTWEGYSPDAPQASDLASIDMLDAIFICVSDAATWARPVI